MLSVDEALERVLELARPLPAVATALSEARGRVLAETIVSDIDSPPHDKSIVDGYAVIAADTVKLPAELAVLEEITAGAVPTRTVERGMATRIMTGAPVPTGADSIVMVEQTDLVGDCVHILKDAKAGQNIVRRGTSLAKGQTVLQPGKLLRPIELGLLAEVGRTMVSAIPRPRVAVLVTGNELVGPSVTPGPGQIRNSNSHLLSGLVQQATGAFASDLGIARDDPAELMRDINAGLSRDVLILSGGVSAGVLDLVPKVLTQLGVSEVFHKVSLKPGKPLWFGHKLRCEGHETLVFGLPGNPVSSLVCFELFVRPAIQKMRGLEPSGLKRISGQLTCDHQQRGERPTYWPAALQGERVTPLSWKGSGDLRTLTDANCLAFFPAGERLFRGGEEVEALLLE
ncbi:MAG TPA: gephyrin-like molybdotransferase Glp [Pirellulaceae bacterium]|jgi:molybdopterin molybdotransferase